MVFAGLDLGGRSGLWCLWCLMAFFAVAVFALAVFAPAVFAGGHSCSSSSIILLTYPSGAE